MLYELATLDIAIGAAPEVAKGVLAWTAEDPKGKLLGMFAADVGALNQVYVLRSYETAADVATERHRVHFSASPFNAGASLLGLSTETYAPFPFVQPAQPGAYGGTYEFRAYTTKTGGIPETLALWEKWLPNRLKLSPLVIAMYALDGAPRFVHVWPYADAGVRSKTRADAVAKGIWPPAGGPKWLATMRSTLTAPLPGSPLH